MEKGFIVLKVKYRKCYTAYIIYNNEAQGNKIPVQATQTHPKNTIQLERKNCLNRSLLKLHTFKRLIIQFLQLDHKYMIILTKWLIKTILILKEQKYQITWTLQLTIAHN